jgi:hypothetical protein
MTLADDARLPGLSPTVRLYVTVVVLAFVFAGTVLGFLLARLTYRCRECREREMRRLPLITLPLTARLPDVAQHRPSRRGPARLGDDRVYRIRPGVPATIVRDRPALTAAPDPGHHNDDNPWWQRAILTRPRHGAS